MVEESRFQGVGTCLRIEGLGARLETWAQGKRPYGFRAWSLRFYRLRAQKGCV